MEFFVNPPEGADHSLHYAQDWIWKKLKPADMRPWSQNHIVFCGPETVILKILTLAKCFLQTA